MIYASTYLLFHPEDVFLAQWTMQELGKRGIITWNDPSDYHSNKDEITPLKEALEKKALVIPFISKAAIQSVEFKKVLYKALDMENEFPKKNHLFPIFLDDQPILLIQSQTKMKRKWISKENKLIGEYFISKNNPNNIARAKDIAKKSAERIFELLNISQQPEVVLYIDQRGNGKRIGEPPNIPEKFKTRDIPALVFRPDNRDRSYSETLIGDDWNDFQNSIISTLETAIGTRKTDMNSKIYLLGESQLGIPFLIGKHFDRTSNVNLYCSDKSGNIFTNQGQERNTPLSGGNPFCYTQSDSIAYIEPGSEIDTISLLLFSNETYLNDVVLYLTQQTGDSHPPMQWVKNDSFVDSDQIMNYVKDVIELLKLMKSQYKKLKTIYLFSGLPFSVIPFLSANLTHVFNNIMFMEYRKDLSSQALSKDHLYAPLQMIRGNCDQGIKHRFNVYQPTTKILFVSANPQLKDPLELEKEKSKINSIIKKHRKKKNIILKSKMSATMSDLMKMIIEETPDILQFSGHGDKLGICLEDENKQIKLISGIALKKLFQTLKERHEIKCVFLNSCYSEVQARAIKEVVPIVIGSSREVSDPVAIAFSVGFYQAIGLGRSITEAFEIGLSAMKGEDLYEKYKFVLL